MKIFDSNVVLLINFECVVKLLFFIITAIECPSLLTPANVEAVLCTDGNNHSSVCTFSCATNFSLVGAANLTCKGNGSSVNGSWDQQSPSCEGI